MKGRVVVKKSFPHRDPHLKLDNLWKFDLSLPWFPFSVLNSLSISFGALDEDRLIRDYKTFLLGEAFTSLMSITIQRLSYWGEKH